jgi:nucleotide-binding universal stress UspA family protein
MIKKILIPLDGSEIGELALVYAKELACTMDLEVQMACATERQDEPTLRMCGLYLEGVAERLQTQVKRVNPRSNIKTVIVDGAPGEAVIDYSEKEAIDLVIITSHGGSGIMPWAMGSTANKIMQRCQAPVLMVRASKSLLKRKPVKVFKKILLPVDGSTSGEASLELVKSIAASLNSEVILVFVVENVQYVHTIGGPDHFAYTEQQIELMKEEGRAYTEKVQRTLKGISVKSIVRVGEPAHEILKAATEENVNLIAMASHGKHGVTRWMLGSVSDKILHAGKEPILLVKSQREPE